MRKTPTTPTSHTPHRFLRCSRSGKSVVLTFWGESAENAEIDGCEGSILQVTNCRVNEYNGE